MTEPNQQSGGPKVATCMQNLSLMCGKTYKSNQRTDLLASPYKQSDIKAVRFSPRNKMANRDWRLCPPIPKPVGPERDWVNKGIITCVHDSGFKKVKYHGIDHSDTNYWMPVHYMDHIIEGLREFIGTRGYVQGVVILCHGDDGERGGFQLGDEKDPLGDNEELRDPDAARLFGEKIRGVFHPGNECSFIAFQVCNGAGKSHHFLQKIWDGIRVIAIGTPDTIIGGHTGGDQGYLWSLKHGGDTKHIPIVDSIGYRVQINQDGSELIDHTPSGHGIWRPFNSPDARNPGLGHGKLPIIDTTDRPNVPLIDEYED